MTEKTQETKMKTNPMQEIKIEKVVLNIGGTADALAKGVKLLGLLAEGQKIAKMKSNKRIPSLSVRPNLEVGAVVTIRKDVEKYLKKMLMAIDNRLKRKQVSSNTFSFGIKEYIEIPGMEYQRDIGMIGLDVTVAFIRAGRRVRLKKMKKGKIPKRQVITKEEIIKFMEEKFGTEFIGK